MSNISRILHTTQLKLVHVFMLLKKIKRILVFGNTVYKYFVISCVNLKKIPCRFVSIFAPNPADSAGLRRRHHAQASHEATCQVTDRSTRRRVKSSNSELWKSVSFIRRVNYRYRVCELACLHLGKSARCP